MDKKTYEALKILVNNAIATNILIDDRELYDALHQLTAWMDEAAKEIED